LRLLDEATLPSSASFPIRWKFAGYGLGPGLAFGVAIAVWLEFRDKAIRNEGDILAGLDLPMLTSIPSVGSAAIGGHHGFRDRLKALVGRKRTAEV